MYSSQKRYQSNQTAPDKPKFDAAWDPLEEVNIHKWVPDLKFLASTGGPYLVYSGAEKEWKVTGWHDEIRDYDLQDVFYYEKKVKNVCMNFGPQHPAAHGVLRLILELEGEVSIRFL